MENKITFAAQITVFAQQIKELKFNTASVHELLRIKAELIEVAGDLQGKLDVNEIIKMFPDDLNKNQGIFYAVRNDAVERLELLGEQKDLEQMMVTPHYKR